MIAQDAPVPLLAYYRGQIIDGCTRLPCRPPRIQLTARVQF